MRIPASFASCDHVDSVELPRTTAGSSEILHHTATVIDIAAFFCLLLKARLESSQRFCPQFTKGLKMKAKTCLSFLIVMTALLGLCGAPSAQNSPRYCTDCNCLVDASCANVTCQSGDTTDCTRGTFTPVCGGVYTLRVELDCQSPGGRCATCCVNSLLRAPDGHSVGGCLSSCATSPCYVDCSTFESLVAGTSYTWFVCYRTCSNSETACSKCGDGGCVARAKLFLHGTDPCPVPPCQ
jgi:hypothetical protein